MSIYRGIQFTGGGCAVVADGDPLDPRMDILCCSESFNWGCEGPGQTQLAIAILAHHFQDDRRAWSCYQEFETQVIATMPDTWEITTAEIETFIDENIPF